MTDAITVARGVLARAALFDPRIQHADAGIVTAWAAALGPLNPADAAAAVIMHYTESADRIMPAHVRANVRRIRATRADRQIEDAPDANPQDATAYLAALREGRHRQADDTDRPRPVAALLAAAPLQSPHD